MCHIYLHPDGWGCFRSEEEHFNCLPLIRAVLEGGGYAPLRFFSRTSQKRHRAAPALSLVHLFSVHTSFLHSLLNSRWGSFKVRSLGHVKWPYLKKVKRPAIATPTERSLLKLLEIDKTNNMHKMIISDFSSPHPYEPKTTDTARQRTDQQRRRTTEPGPNTGRCGGP